LQAPHLNPVFFFFSFWPERTPTFPTSFAHNLAYTQTTFPPINVTPQSDPKRWAEALNFFFRPAPWPCESTPYWFFFPGRAMVCLSPLIVGEVYLRDTLTTCWHPCFPPLPFASFELNKRGALPVFYSVLFSVLFFCFGGASPSFFWAGQARTFFLGSVSPH